MQMKFTYRTYRFTKACCNVEHAGKFNAKTKKNLDNLTPAPIFKFAKIFFHLFKIPLSSYKIVTESKFMFFCLYFNDGFSCVFP